MQKSEYRYAFADQLSATRSIYADEPFVALRYATGVWAHRLIGGHRQMYDATSSLRSHCRWCAGEMIHRWPGAPALFLEWCATGDKSMEYDTKAALDHYPPESKDIYSVILCALNAQEPMMDDNAIWWRTIETTTAAIRVFGHVEPVRDEFNRLIANGFE